MAKDAKVKRTVRHYTPKQLVTRPLALPTCEGEVVISARTRKGRIEVLIERPAESKVMREESK